MLGQSPPSCDRPGVCSCSVVGDLWGGQAETNLLEAKPPSHRASRGLSFAGRHLPQQAHTLLPALPHPALSLSRAGSKRLPWAWLHDWRSR